VQLCVSETQSNAQSCERSQSQRQGGEGESRVRTDMDHSSKKARDPINSLSNRTVLVREEGPSALLQLSSEDMGVVSLQQLQLAESETPHTSQQHRSHTSKGPFICITVILHSENELLTCFWNHTSCSCLILWTVPRVAGPVRQFLFKIVSRETPWSVYFFRRGLALVTSLPWHWVSLQKRVRGFETAGTARNKEQLPTVDFHSFIFQMETMKLQDVVTNGG